MERDLRRFQADEPIHYRRPSALRRAVLFWRRNRLLVSFSAVLLLFLLTAVVGTSLAAVSFLNLARAESKARGEAEGRLVRNYLREGVRLADAGDALAGRPLFAEAFRFLGPGAGEDRLTHRVRLGLLAAQTPRRLRPFSHDRPPAALACDPTGRVLAVAENDRPGTPPNTDQTFGNVWLWDIDSGARLAGPLRHEDPVTALAFSPDGKTLAVATGETTGRQGAGAAHLYEVPSGRPLGEPMRHPGLGKDDPGVAAGLRGRLRDAVLVAVGVVTHVAFSPDGRRLVTCGDEATARVWDARTGQPTGVVVQNNRAVHHAAFSPDGRTVVTASDDVRVWDVATGRLRYPPLAGKQFPRWAAFSPDGRLLAVAGLGGAAGLWDAASGRPIRDLPRQEQSLTQALFTPNGAQLLTVAQGEGLVIWDVESGRSLRRLPHPGAERAAVLADGLTVISTGSDVRAWDLVTGRELYRLPGQLGTAHADGLRLFAAAGSAVWLWQPPTTAPQRLAASPPLDTTLARLAPDGTRVLTAASAREAGGEVSYLRLFATATGAAVGPPWRQPGATAVVAFSPDGSLAATTGSDGRVEVRHTATGQPAREPLAHPATVLALALGPGGRQLACAAADRRVWLHDVTGPAEPVVLTLPLPALLLAFSPDGSRVLTACGEEQRWEARVWDAAAGQPVGPAFDAGAEVVGGSLTPGDGPAVVWTRRGVGIVETRLHVWAPQSGQEVAAPLTDQTLGQPEFIGDGRLLVAGGQLYDLATLRPATSVSGSRAALSPDATAVAVAGWQAAGRPSVRLWDLEGRPLTPPFAVGGDVRALRFSPDGRLLLTLGIQLSPTTLSEVRLWDVRTGDPVGLPWVLPWQAEDALFTPDGRAVAVLSGGTHLGPWALWAPLEPSDDRPEVAVAEARLAAGLAIDDTGSLAAIDLNEAWGAAPPPDDTAVGRRRWQLAQAGRCEDGHDAAGTAWRLEQAAAAGASGPDLAARLGRAYLGQRRWDDAVRHLTQALDQGPGDWPLRAHRGAAHLGRRDWPRALDDLNAAVALGADDTAVRVHRAVARAESGDAAGAAEDVAVAYEPAAENVLMDQASSALQENYAAGNWRTVLVLSDYLFRRDPAMLRLGVRVVNQLTAPDVHAYRSAARLALGDVSAADEEWNRACQWGDAAAVDRLFVAGLNVQLGRTPDAPRLLLERGQACLRLGEPRQAIPDFARILELAPDEHAVWAWLANAHTRCEDWVRADECFTRAIDRSERPGARMYRERGGVRAELDHLADAEADLRTAVRLDGKQAESWKLLALAQLARGEADEFRATLAELRQRAQSDGGLWATWAWLSAVGDDKADAAELLRQAERLAGQAPEAPETRLLQALALLRGGRPADAEAVLAKWPRAEVEARPEACLLLARCAERLGRAEDRRSWSRRAEQATARANPDWSRRITLRELARR